MLAIKTRNQFAEYEMICAWSSLSYDWQGAEVLMEKKSHFCNKNSCVPKLSYVRFFYCNIYIQIVTPINESEIKIFIKIRIEAADATYHIVVFVVLFLRVRKIYVWYRNVKSYFFLLRMRLQKPFQISLQIIRLIIIILYDIRKDKRSVM